MNTVCCIFLQEGLRFAFKLTSGKRHLIYTSRSKVVISSLLAKLLVASFPCMYFLSLHLPGHTPLTCNLPLLRNSLPSQTYRSPFGAHPTSVFPNVLSCPDTLPGLSRSAGVRPHIGAGSPHFGAGSPLLGQEVPVLGQEVPVLGQEVPVLGQEVPVLGQESPHVGAGKSPCWGWKVPMLGLESPHVGAGKSSCWGRKVPMLGQESPHVGAGKSPCWGRTVPMLGQDSPRIGAEK